MKSTGNEQESQKINVNIYQQWGNSKHFRANIGCLECHEAQKGDVDAFEHEGNLISVIVPSPSSPPIYH